MNRDQFRQEITQRYVVGKALDGASVDDISRGLLDPHEQMNYVSSQIAPRRRTSSSAQDSAAVAGFVVLIVAGLFLISILSIILR